MRALTTLSLTLALSCALGCSTPATIGSATPEGTARATNSNDAGEFTMARVRAELDTQVFLETSPDAPDEPPAGVLELVQYPAELGDNFAYVTPARSGKPGPGIVWIHGGFDWGISAYAWEPAPRDDDQSARAFREAGIAMVLPSLRGSSGNPGRNECMAGEVDDLIAAGRYLASRPDVDPKRVYLGGHSTGGTLALLTAQSTDLFAGVFAFGPIDDVAYYQECPLPAGQGPELEVRQPIAHLDEVRSPTFIIEGAEGGNIDSLPALEHARGEAPVHIVHVPLADHFSVLAPGTEVVARALLEGRDLRDRDAITMPELLAALVGDSPAITLPTMTAVGVVRAQRLPEAASVGMRMGAIAGCKDAGGTDCESFLAPLAQASVEAEAALLLAQFFGPEQLVSIERYYTSPAGRRIMDETMRAIRAGEPVAPRPSEILTEAEQAQAEAFVTSAHGSDYFSRYDEVNQLLAERLQSLVQ